MSKINNDVIQKWFLSGALITIILNLLGFIADLDQISSSNWVPRVLSVVISMQFVKWVSFILNFALIGVVFFLFNRFKKSENFHIEDDKEWGKRLESERIENDKLWEKKLESDRIENDRLWKEMLENQRLENDKLWKQTLENKHEELIERLNNQRLLNDTLWKKIIRTLRAIFLKTVSKNTNIQNTLEPLIDELCKRLPDNGTNFKIAIAQPLSNGTFSILHQRGMDAISVTSIQEKANWLSGDSFFAQALSLDEDKPYYTYLSNSDKYVKIQNKASISSSKSHFIVAIKHSNYPDSIFPKNGLGLLSIGIPQKHYFEHEDPSEICLFQDIFPIIKGIESILLTHRVIEMNKGLELI